MENRTMAFRRHQRWAHINRKKYIIKLQGGYWHYKYDGDLDKGKIHCSCPMCRSKSYDQASASDVRKTVSAMQELQGFGTEGRRAIHSILSRVRVKG